MNNRSSTIAVVDGGADMVSTLVVRILLDVLQEEGLWVSSNWSIQHGYCIPPCLGADDELQPFLVKDFGKSCVEHRLPMLPTAAACAGLEVTLQSHRVRERDLRVVVEVDEEEVHPMNLEHRHDVLLLPLKTQSRSCWT
jgi:hypothetical protein